MLAAIVLMALPVLSRAQTKPADYLEKGMDEYEKGDLDAAIRDFTFAIQMDGKSVQAYGNRGKARYFKKDYQGALQDFSQVIELEPNKFDGWHTRALAKEALHDLEGAIADYTRAIELNPQDRAAYLNRGLDKLNKGDFDQALADCEASIKLDPTYAFGFGGRASVKFSKDDLDGALADFNRALQLDPKFDGMYAGRGRVYVAQQKWQAALADFRHDGNWEQSDKDYIAFDVWMIRSRSGDGTAASQELALYLQNRKGKLDDWEVTIGKFLLGKIPEADLLTEAKAADQKAGADVLESAHLNGAWYYAGLKRLLNGDKDTAAEDFKKCIAEGKKASFTYHYAQAELKAVGNREK